MKLSNDPDFVEYTAYSKEVGNMPDLPKEPPPDWEPLRITNPRIFGEAQIPEGIAGDPIALFGLFFDTSVLDAIAYHTNRHAELLRQQLSTEYCRGWKPTSTTELYTYFAIVLYMGVHREPSLVEYWEKGHSNAPRHSINQYMSQKRWQQLDRYLYCAEVEQKFSSPFGRVWDLSETLRARCFKYWTPGKHLCVDEAIARFTGRAKEIVIIKTKPTPEGYKIWCLASDGVILNWLFHAKGAGRRPVNLRGGDDAASRTFTPTESVPVTLVLALDADGQRLFPPDLHVVWDDNLFNTIPMLEYLRKKGVGCAGTVRTTRTLTEEHFDKVAIAKVKLISGDRAAAHVKLFKERFNSDLVRVKTHYTNKMEWGETRWALSASKKVLKMVWRNSQVVLFASTVAEREYLTSWC